MDVLLMGLLDGGIARIMASAFAPLYLDATLYRKVALVLDAGGSATGGGWTAEPVKAQLDQANEAMRQQNGYTDSDQRILVLASGVATITTDCEIEVKGQRWAIASVGQDPAGSYYDLRGRRA